MTLESRCRDWLASPSVPFRVALLGFVLLLPSLAAGLATEDWIIRELSLRPVSASTLNLYATLTSKADVLGAQREGLLPWFASPDLRLAFWRPLASLSAFIDYRVLGDAVWLMHLESIALYAGLVFLVARLYRRLMSDPWLSGLAALLFAVDDAHGRTVGWLANRNALLSALFGVAALLCHDRWRRHGSRKDALLAPLLLAGALLSGELGLSVVAYLAAHALFLDRGPRRVFALLPSVAVVGVWAGVRRALGVVTQGSGIYLDPLASPAEYFSELPHRLGALLGGQLAHPPADSWVIDGDASHRWLLLGGLVVAALLFLQLRPALAKSSARAASLRFAFTGMLLSLLVPAATFPSDRMLLISGVGASMCLAQAIGVALEASALHTKAVAAGFALMHLVAAPALLPWRALTMSRYHERVVAGSESAYASVVTGDDVVVALNAPDHYYCSLLRAMRHHVGRGPTAPVICLAATRGPVTVSRLDDNAVVVEVPEGFLAEPLNRIFRSRREPLRAGAQLYAGNFEAIVTQATASGEPTAASFRFNWSLSSAKLRFVTFEGERFVPVVLPAVGGTVRLPGS
ncbi:MAG: hypothetical protein IPI67_25020 [Myxococcales bacterium]|nr:hypothetical protein [Myxococcales bacterium]